jgi:deoxyxylulose-5-phosphate synthase
MLVYMLRTALVSQGPMAIRYPRGAMSAMFGRQRR